MNASFESLALALVGGLSLVAVVICVLLSAFLLYAFWIMVKHNRGVAKYRSENSVSACRCGAFPDRGSRCSACLEIDQHNFRDEHNLGDYKESDEAHQ